MTIASITIGDATIRTIVAWLVIGLITGFLASKVMRGSGRGISGDVVFSLLGSFIGGIIASLIHLDLGLGSVLNIQIGYVIIAFLGACLLLLLSRFFTMQRGKGPA